MPETGSAVAKFGAWAMVTATVFDSLEFARSGQKLQGVVAVAQLGRLADSLFDATGELSYRLSGGVDARQRPRITLAVEGELNLRCQRCLERLAFRVDAVTDLLILTEACAAGSTEIEDLDGIPASANCDAWALVEDEVLLVIPFAARHPDGHCSAAVKADDSAVASPFAVLAKLKQDRIQN